MQFYYDEKMPLRILDEGQFWKHQEAEHTDVIRELAPQLEPQFKEALAKWKLSFSETEGIFVRYIETVVRSGHPLAPSVIQQIISLVHYSLQQSEQFIKLLNQMAAQSQAIKNNPTALVVLQHIRRESEYFIGISQAILSK